MTIWRGEVMTTFSSVPARAGEERAFGDARLSLAAREQVDGLGPRPAR
jgi:hypothetical protein